MSKFKGVLFIAGGALLLILFFRTLKNEPVSLFNLDGFAKCLAEKQVTMYGAYSCVHCQNQKKMFGDSFQYVPYVECTQEPKKCMDAGVQAFPTWINAVEATDAAAPKLTGEVSLEKLAAFSGCTLPKE